MYGGQKIDKHYGHWMETHAQLTEENPGTVAASAVVARRAAGATKFQQMAAAGGVTDTAGGVSTTTARYVPLRFWFCRNAGLALPLIALQYHEVKVIVNWSAAVAAASSTVSSNVSLWADYVYLDTDERRRFAQVSHEYLIEQVQHQDASASALSTELNFNHPVKELIWAGKTAQTWGAAHADAGMLGDVSTAQGNNWQLKLNGHDRFAEQDTNYFTKLQVWKYHTGAMQEDDSIAVYSFALKPEEHQPSGTCNFSRIDNAQLKSSAAATAQGMNIYAVNTMSSVSCSVGGLAYSN